MKRYIYPGENGPKMSATLVILFFDKLVDCRFENIKIRENHK